MSKVLPVSITTTRDGSQSANLGSSQLAQAVSLGLKVEFGGTVERSGGDILYYNGACEVRGDAAQAKILYQAMVDRVVR